MLSKEIEKRGGPDKAPRWMVAVRIVGKTVTELLWVAWLLYIGLLAASGVYTISRVGGINRFLAEQVAWVCARRGFTVCPPTLVPGVLVAVVVGLLITAAIFTVVMWVPTYRGPSAFELARRLLTWIERRNTK
ncbi:MAG: hypothetical protein IT317_13680 [Anaerolineales bacterium]|nr:hypothetical protein [Anaerolineales bacterium]